MRAVRDMDLTRTARQHAAAFYPEGDPSIGAAAAPKCSLGASSASVLHNTMHQSAMHM